MQEQTSPSFLDRVRNQLEGLPLVEEILGLIALVVVAYLADVLARRQLTKVIERIADRTSVTWDDQLIHNKVFERLAHLAPAAVVYFGIRLVPNVADAIDALVQSVAGAYMVFTVALAVSSTLTSINDIYDRYPVARSRPIKGYLQVGKIIIWVLASVLIIATLMNRSPLIFLSGIGALTAVLMLVFKDTILSLVASIQLAQNDMVRVGDWIEMSHSGADGDVVDIALHTVTVQNWDKTVTTIPTYKLIQDSFKNWRAMSESGGRRIKRSLFIDKSTIRFLTEEEVGRFKRFALLEEYIETKQRDLLHSKTDVKSGDDWVNTRHLTNIGTFRAYVVNYLKNHPMVHKDMTLLVRQLQPTPNGLPIEIYIFTNDTAWVAYEGIQADIFDHLMAIIPEFGLKLFQNPSGNDLQRLGVKPSVSSADRADA